MKSSDELRPYQENILNAVLQAINNGQKEILLKMAVGTGKTAVIGQLVKELYGMVDVSKKRILILTARLKILEQIQYILSKKNMPNSTVSQANDPIVLTTYSRLIKALSNNISNIYFDYVLCVNAEEATNQELKDILHKSADCTLIGFANTMPIFKGWFTGVSSIFNYSIADGIKEGYLDELNNSKYYSVAVEGFCQRLFSTMGLSFDSNNTSPVFLISNSQPQIFVDIKTYRNRFISIPALNQAVFQLLDLKASHEHNKSKTSRLNFEYCLIIFGEVSEELRDNIYKKHRITVWDISNLLYFSQNDSQLLNDLIKLAFFPIEELEACPPIGWTPPVYIEDLSSAIPDDSIVADYENKLLFCKAGKKSAIDYENICSEIILYLFGNEFTLASKQHSTSDEMFRIDLICTLKGSAAFWELLIRHYNSRFIVFEYKNYTDKLSQNLIYVTEKYLFNAALRNVAIIISRKGFSENANAAANGCLKENGKLILELTDKDLIAMLKKKATGEEPSDYLLEKLETLLMSISK